MTVRLDNLLCQLKKMHNLSMEIVFYLVDKTEDLSLDTASQIALRYCSKEVDGEGQYICDFGEGRVHAIKNIVLQNIS